MSEPDCGSRVGHPQHGAPDRTDTPTLHSPFEHTFLWVIDADDPHLVEEFTLETGLSSFNNLRIVPLKTLVEGVIPRVKAVHRL